MNIFIKLFLIIIGGLLIIPQTAIARYAWALWNDFENTDYKKNRILLNSSERTFEVLSISRSNNINKVLKEESKAINLFFNNLLFSNNPNLAATKEFSFEVESDSQYVQDDIFYAEGNVIISLPYGIFRAEKISFDKKNRVFKAYKDIQFEKGRQYFNADYLKYDLNNYEGKIDNIYGIVDFRNISKDLGFDFQNSDNQCKVQSVNLINPPSEIELLGSQNLRFKNSRNLKFSLDFSKISQWRFKSEQITLNKNKWEADLIYFTNDPFNKPQLKIKSKDFFAETISGITSFKSRSTYLNIEDKLQIPLGSRSISDSNVQSKWGFGYETKNKDGFFISRTLETIDISKQFSLDFKQYFLIQRLIQGYTKSFRDKDEIVVSENRKTDISFADFFGMNAELRGKISTFDLDSNIDMKTYNIDKFYDAFSIDFNLSKNIYSYSKSKNKLNKSCQINNSENISENFDINIGYYSLFNRDDIYFGNGLKILNNYNFIKDNLNKNYSFIIDYGHFKGKSSSNENKLLDHSRYGFNIALNHKLKLIDLNNEKDIYDSEYKYLPEINNKGLFLNANLGSGFYQYSNGDNQNIISLGFGPSLKIGNLKSNFLDYTKLSLLTSVSAKENRSPFIFDDFSNNSRVKVDLEQQLFGPVILGFKGEYNINSKSSEYGLIENKIYNIRFSRRAYELNLEYYEKDKAIYFGFGIFNFGYKNKSPKF